MSSKKVLIVEDEMIIALLIERMVTNLGHTVVDKVTSGEEAVAAAVENEPDIILMDIRLEGEIDGVEAIMQIRKNKNIPVIYISGNTDAAHKKRVEQTEYVEFLSKPISISDLNRSFDCAS